MNKATPSLAGALLGDADDERVRAMVPLDPLMVVGVRITTSMIMSGAAEILCYATAVLCEDARAAGWRFSSPRAILRGV